MVYESPLGKPRNHQPNRLQLHFRGNKLGYAPNRFSYPFLRTVILLLRTKETSFVCHDMRGFFMLSGKNARNTGKTAEAETGTD